VNRWVVPRSIRPPAGSRYGAGPSSISLIALPRLRLGWRFA
jgi:hypothetical protein